MNATPFWLARAYSLHRHILPVIGDFRLSEITFEMIQEGLVQKMLDAGYAVQTAREARRVAHTVFRHALRVRCFIGHPPTIGTRFPAVRRKRTSALTISQATAVIEAFRNPFKAMALVSMTMGMSLPEVTALRWKCINLSSAPIFCDGEMIPANSAAVWETFHRGSFGVPRTENRWRCLPLPEAVARELLTYRITTKFTGPDDIVFATRNGTPYLLSYLHDRIKEVGRDLGLPWLSWSCFRNTHAMLAQQLGVSLSDRQAQMGLAAAWMMERYPDSEIELQRVGGEAIARKVT